MSSVEANRGIVGAANQGRRSSDKMNRLFDAENSSLFLTHPRPCLLAANLSASTNALSNGRSIRVVRRLIRVDGGAEGREKELIAESVVDSKML